LLSNKKSAGRNRKISGKKHRPAQDYDSFVISRPGSFILSKPGVKQNDAKPVL